MSIMSFAHLKEKKATDIPHDHEIRVSVASQDVRKPVSNQGGVLSFAYLKKKRPADNQDDNQTPVDAIQGNVSCEQKTEKSKRTFFTIPAVMPTALLSAVNYCAGCGRFMKALPEEQAIGNKYGRCFRSVVFDADGCKKEIWKVIPDNVTVSSCYFNINK